MNKPHDIDKPNLGKVSMKSGLGDRNNEEVTFPGRNLIRESQ